MRVGDSVWYCSKLLKPAADGQQFAKPVEIRTAFGQFTVMGKSGYHDLLEFGVNIRQYLTAIAQPYERWCCAFNEGDLFYCDCNAPSDDEEFYGQNANYVVDTVDRGNRRIKLTLKRVVD